MADFTFQVTGFVFQADGEFVFQGSSDPQPQERFSGGWEHYANRARRRIEDDIRADRIRWGILPKAAQVISELAIKQADHLELGSEARLQQLEDELKLHGIESVRHYMQILNLQRQKLIDAEIKGYFDAQQALDEENTKRLLLLMSLA